MTAAGGADKRPRAVPRVVTRAAIRRQIHPIVHRVVNRNARSKMPPGRGPRSLRYRRTNPQRGVGTDLAILGGDIGGR